MKKRLISCALLAALLVTSLCVPARAAGDFCFIAVNDTIPTTLTSGSMPFYTNAGLFVPYTAFDSEPCGIVSAYNAADQTFVLFTRSKRLIFNLADGTVTDENKNESNSLTTFKNGILYVPVMFCVSHFGLSLSILTSKDGYMVLRFTDGSQVYDDSLFIEKAENLIAYRVSQYSSTSTKPSPVQTPGTTDTPTPTQPVQTDSKPETHAAVYLAFTGISNVPAALDALSAASLSGTFFLTADEMEQNPGLIRTLYASGHKLGLTVPENTADVAAALAAANETLDGILNIKSVMVLLTAEQASGLSGYRIFTRPAQADALPDSASEKSQAPQLYLCTQNPAQALTQLQAEGDNLLLLRETSPVS